MDSISDLTFIKLLLLLILSKWKTTRFFTQYFRHTATMELLQTLLVVAACLVMTADSVMFYLEANARKCLAEEIRQNILVTGEFEVSEMAGQQVVIENSIILPIIIPSCLCTVK